MNDFIENFPLLYIQNNEGCGVLRLPDTFWASCFVHFRYGTTFLYLDICVLCVLLSSLLLFSSLTLLTNSMSCVTSVARNKIFEVG